MSNLTPEAYVACRTGDIVVPLVRQAFEESMKTGKAGKRFTRAVTGTVHEIYGLQMKAYEGLEKKDPHAPEIYLTEEQAKVIFNQHLTMNGLPKIR
ncbi:MAG: hypothetical protein NT120_03260 [Candidatus Aenigmarchaeota archaeon]|nr:hypothetical protein [Candidatus Aenigmarchaeota archaeon]